MMFISHVVYSLYPAHDSGITTLSIAKDNENNTWYGEAHSYPQFNLCLYRAQLYRGLGFP